MFNILPVPWIGFTCQYIEQTYGTGHTVATGSISLVFKDNPTIFLVMILVVQHIIGVHRTEKIFSGVPVNK